MKTITFSNQKGGVGKTTAVTMLANIFSLPPFNKSILVIDQDAQISTYNCRKRDLEIFDDIPSYDVITLNTKDTEIFFTEAINGKLTGNIKEDNKKRVYYETILTRKYNLIGEKNINIENQSLYNFDPNKSIEQNYDYIFLDMPGTLASEDNLKGVLLASDAIVMPFKPSSKDLESTFTFIEIMLKIRKHRKEYNLELPMYSFLNEHLNTNDFTIAKQFDDFFTNNDITFSKVHLRRRNVYLRIGTIMKSLYETAIEDANNDKNISQSAEIKKFTNEFKTFLESVTSPSLNLV